MQTPKRTGVDWRERRLSSKLYVGQSVELKLDQGEARNVKIGSGFRQGSCLSPLLFDVYSELLTKEVVEKFEGFIIGQVFLNVKYAYEHLCYWLRKRRYYRAGLID
jgi:hypothetical protein